MVNAHDLDRTLTALAPHLEAGAALAVGVSGGPDSMALTHLLTQLAAPRGWRIAAYTVDHGLRADSADEAAKVGHWINGWPHVTHRVLRWIDDKPDSRILEAARDARYALIAQAMRENGQSILMLGHHRDDQAETFLMRLAAGSGLDGLAGMQPRQTYGGLVILRPLLDVDKADLVAYCAANAVPYVDDPTNANADYLRPRLRGARAILEAEGLSSKRLGMTAKRLARAREALDQSADALRYAAAVPSGDGKFEFDVNVLRDAPEDLLIRVLLKLFDELRPGKNYAPRLERVEALTLRILYDTTFNGATLGGCKISLHSAGRVLCVEKES